jgi:hypothetical protein
MKTLNRRAEDILAEAAMREEGSRLGPAAGGVCDPFVETLEENLVEIAFAEAADYDNIHESILREHLRHCRAA